jgi:hypothetical protein
MFHLNQFYEKGDDIYSYVSNPTLNIIKKRMDQEGHHHEGIVYNIMLYGRDTSLLKYLTHQLIRWNVRAYDLKSRVGRYQHNDVEIEYKYSNYHIQIDFDQNLSREKLTCLEFLRSICSQKTVASTKRIVVLLNIHRTQTTIQDKLRSLIEKSHSVNTYIGLTNNLSRVSSKIQSFFACYRIPVLTLTQKEDLTRYLLTQGVNTMCDPVDRINANNLENDELNLVDSVAPCVMSHIKKIDDFEDVLLFVLSVSAQRLNQPIVLDDIAMFHFLENELQSVVKAFLKKTKHSIVPLIEKIRHFIYKIIHYNIPHEIVCNTMAETVIHLCKNKKQIPFIVKTITTLEYEVRQVHMCKVIHVYEKALIALYGIMNNFLYVDDD